MTRAGDKFQSRGCPVVSELYELVLRANAMERVNSLSFLAIHLSGVALLSLTLQKYIILANAETIYQGPVFPGFDAPRISLADNDLLN